MSFCTVINCIDGRVQLPVNSFLQKRFMVNYVDSITEPGVNRVLAEQEDKGAVDSVLKRLGVSVKAHQPVGIAVVGHYDCAGNPLSEEEQTQHTLAAVRFIKECYPDLTVIGLWVNEFWNVIEL